MSDALTRPGLGLLPSGKVLAAGSITSKAGDDHEYYVVQLYDPTTRTWAKAADLPRPSSAPTMLTLTDGRLALAGTWDTASSTSIGVQLYNPTTSTWSSGPNMVVEHYYPRVVTLGTKAMLLEASGASLVDLTTATWSAAPAGPGGAVTAVGGGKAFAVERTTAATYDVATNVWTTRATPPVDVSAAAATLLSNGRVLLVGGRLGLSATPSTTAYQYDLTTNTWSTSGDIAAPHYERHEAFTIGDRAVVVGGLGVVVSGRDPPAASHRDQLHGRPPVQERRVRRLGLLRLCVVPHRQHLCLADVARELPQEAGGCLHRRHRMRLWLLRRQPLLQRRVWRAVRGVRRRWRRGDLHRRDGDTSRVARRVRRRWRGDGLRCQVRWRRPGQVQLPWLGGRLRHCRLLRKRRDTRRHLLRSWGVLRRAEELRDLRVWSHRVQDELRRSYRLHRGLLLQGRVVRAHGRPRQGLHEGQRLRDRLLRRRGLLRRRLLCRGQCLQREGNGQGDLRQGAGHDLQGRRRMRQWSLHRRCVLRHDLRRAVRGLRRTVSPRTVLARQRRAPRPPSCVWRRHRLRDKDVRRREGHEVVRRADGRSHEDLRAGEVRRHALHPGGHVRRDRDLPGPRGDLVRALPMRRWWLQGDVCSRHRLRPRLPMRRGEVRTADLVLFDGWTFGDRRSRDDDQLRAVPLQEGLLRP
ncbi:MAG: hypothetical protein IPJ34_23285 [Myxococcales bacterium]|nr:hypothetical protein [Myxococcales bacterium]